jgi:3-hydroxyacyl-CoA dehydrogenase
LYRTTILATNTSSLSLADIGVNLKRQSHFGGLHFFNPVPVMQLLEVVRTDATSDATYAALLEFGKRVGKTTVQCKVRVGKTFFPPNFIHVTSAQKNLIGNK